MRMSRIFPLILLDLFLVALCYISALCICFEVFPYPGSHPFLLGFFSVMVAKISLFAASGLYAPVWRRGTIRDIYQTFRAVTFSSLISAFVLIFMQGPQGLTRQFYFWDWALLTALMSLGRFLLKPHFASRGHSQREEDCGVMIAPASDNIAIPQRGHKPEGEAWQ